MQLFIQFLYFPFLYRPKMWSVDLITARSGSNSYEVVNSFLFIKEKSFKRN